MNRKRNIIGNRYGRLVVISETYDGNPVCRCDCGKIHTPNLYDLVYGKTRSCGCLRHTYDRPANRGSKSGYPGVYRRNTGKYVACITYNRKSHYLGIYDNLDDAVNARNEAGRVYYSIAMQSTQGS